jgi:hypothetical protein
VYGQANFSGFRKEPRLVRIWNTHAHDDNYLIVNISSAQKLLPPIPGKTHKRPVARYREGVNHLGMNAFEQQQP